MTSELYFHVTTAAAALRDRIEERHPRLAVVLGSALGGFASRCEDAIPVAYSEVPHMRTPTAAGHAGRFVSGRVEGLDVLVLSGRLHYYEGYGLDEVTFPVRVVAALGIETLVLTNAAGGLDPAFAAGDLMLIEDHINLTGENPLRGPNDERLGPRFPHMADLYDAGLREAVGSVADELGVALRRGVYAGVAGPSYETSAEIRMLRALGADAVGMSTVPEAIVARHAGLRLAGISCITNAAAGASGGALTHTEVMTVAERSAGAFDALLAGLCRRLAS
jgi:purine-nucleoside phosphorylase